MPSAASFRLAASRFDELADECRTLDGPVAATDATGGPAGSSRVRSRIGDALDMAMETADGIVDLCAQLAEVARERAQACEQYEAALRSYHAAHHTWSQQQVEWRFAQLDPERPPSMWPGAEPVPPDRPEFYSAGERGRAGR